MKPLISKGLATFAVAALSCIAFEKSANAQCPVGFTSISGSSLSADITDYPYGNSSQGSLSATIPSTFLIDVTAAGQAIPVGLYEAWCVDEQTPQSETPAITFYTVPGTPNTGILYATCDANLNAELAVYGNHPNTTVSASTWLEVDYILSSNKVVAPTASYWDIQAAINTLVGSAAGYTDPYCGLLTTPLPDGCPGYPTYNPANVNALLTSAAAEVKAGWTPTCGDLIGVIYVTSPTSQFLVIGIPYTAPPTITVTPGKNEGCNGSNALPTDITVLTTVTVSPGCCGGTATPVARHVDTSNGCFWTRTFTITATEPCGLSATNTATYTWVNDTTGPIFTKLPTGGFEGCGLTNVPTMTELEAMVGSGIVATAACGTPNIVVMSDGSDITNECTGTRTFTVTAYDQCTSLTSNLVYTWTISTNISMTNITTTVTPVITITTNTCTNTICGNFNSQNSYGCKWVWLNSHITSSPGKPCAVYCQNASVTLTCQGGKTYTFACPNGQINFSSTCKTATNWFDGTQWNTTLPCSGDSQIFLQGCAIPWQSDFANCQSVCWTGVFSCSVPGYSCNWQFGNSCYSCGLPGYNTICPKACYQTPCQNGYYFNNGDQAGCPENYTPYCVGGGWGNWGYNWSCNWSGSSPTCTCGGVITNTNYITTYSTNITTTNECLCSVTPPCYSNSICGNFNSQNPGCGSVWCNAHLSCNPGKECTISCHNASITLVCTDGKTYTFPVPDCQVNFATNCTTASCSYTGSSWTTTVPCAGDSQIFLSGCGIPWQNDFANCHSVTWSGTFCCSTPGVNCNWQWGAACYSVDLSNPAYCNYLGIKPCLTAPCGYNNGDQCGTPENCKTWLQAGACGGGGSNCTGSWSSTGSCGW